MDTMAADENSNTTKMMEQIKEVSIRRSDDVITTVILEKRVTEGVTSNGSVEISQREYESIDDDAHTYSQVVRKVLDDNSSLDYQGGDTNDGDYLNAGELKKEVTVAIEKRTTMAEYTNVQTFEDVHDDDDDVSRSITITKSVTLNNLDSDDRKDDDVLYLNQSEVTASVHTSRDHDDDDDDDDEGKEVHSVAISTHRITDEDHYENEEHDRRKDFEVGYLIPAELRHQDVEERGNTFIERVDETRQKMEGTEEIRDNLHRVEDTRDRLDDSRSDSVSSSRGEAQLYEEIEDVVREAKTDIREEVRDDIKQEIKEEIKENIREAVSQDIKEEIREEIKERVEEEVRDGRTLEINRTADISTQKNNTMSLTVDMSIRKVETSAEQRNELKSPSGVKSPSSSGLFVLRNARQKDATHFMQHVRDMASGQTNDLEKGAILTILRSTSRDDNVTDFRNKPQNRRSIVTNDLVKQFESASAGGGAVFPTSPSHVTTDLKHGTSRQTSFGKSELKSPNKEFATITKNTTVTVTKSGSEEVKAVGTITKEVAVTTEIKSSEDLAKQLELKLKAKEQLKQQEEEQHKKNTTQQVTTNGSIKVTTELLIANGDALARPSTLVVEDMPHTQNIDTSGRVIRGPGPIPQWQLDLRERNRSKRVSATSPTSPGQQGSSATSPNSPPWMLDLQHRKVKVTSISDAEPNQK